jgi:hypothetical protein
MPNKVIKYILISAGVLALLLAAVFLYPTIIKADITTGLVGWWKFDEGTGTTTADSSGNNNTGTLNNDPTWTTGKYGNAISFDGTNDYIYLASDTVSTNTITVCAWMYPKVLNQWRMIIGNARFFFGVSNANNSLALFSDSSKYNAVASANNSISLNIWQHICGVRLSDGSTSLYINGTQSGTSGNSGIPVIGFGLAIGAADVFGDYTFNGLIDEVRIYNRALAASEVLELYNYTSGGTPTPTPSATPSPTPTPSGTPTPTPSATPTPTPTPDTTPPVRSSGSPSGTLLAGTTQTTLSLSTSENAICKYSTVANTSYSSMTNTFSTTGGTTHSSTITGLSNGNTYNYYIRCQDTAGNANTDDYAVSFSVSSLSTGEIIPLNRRVTWQGNVGLAFCSNSSYLTQATCTTGGGTWYTDVPVNTIRCGSLITTTNNSTDRTTEINNALSSCANTNKYVELGPGHFTIAGSINMKSGVTLRGQGMGTSGTILDVTYGGFVVIFQGATCATPSGCTIGGVSCPNNNGGPCYGLTTNLTATDLAKGSTTIHTSFPHGWNTGDIILIDQLHNGGTGDPPVYPVGNQGPQGGNGRGCWLGLSTCRPIGQYVKLITASGSDATFDIPLYWSYQTSQTVQGTKMVQPFSRAGLEDLTLDGGTTYPGWFVLMNNADNCWIKGVEFKNTSGYINIQSTFRMLFRDNYVHGANAYKSTYGLGLAGDNSAALIENNIWRDMASGPVMTGANSGNVFAYNYVREVKLKLPGLPPNGCLDTVYPGSDECPYVRPGMDIHGAHAMMNLYEGNYLDGAGFAADNEFGSSSHNTLFRNYITHYGTWNAAYYQLLADIGLAHQQWYTNAVGNIIGSYGHDPVWESNDGYSGQGTVWYMDFAPVGPFDQVRSTLLRHNNWDGYHNGVKYCDDVGEIGCQGGDASHALPVSLYLTSKPSWFGSVPWPPAGPDVAGLTNKIPAQLRYEAMIGGDTTPPAAPTGVTVN